MPIQRTALFINGVLKSVLQENLDAQSRGAATNYLQPHKPIFIRSLERCQPSRSSPRKLYLSLTDDLGRIRYTAEIIDWENKQAIVGRVGLHARRGWP